MAAELHQSGNTVSIHQPPPTVLTAPPADSSGLAPTLKRHRRPSVRLGEIGDQPATLRTSKSWNPNPSKSSSKTRPITNLVTVPNGNSNPTNTNLNSYCKELKFKRTELKFKRTSTGVKRLRATNLHNEECQLREDNEDNKDNDADVGDGEGFRDFDPKSSDHEHEPDFDVWQNHNRRSFRGSVGVNSARVSDADHDLRVDSLSGSDCGTQGGKELGVDEGVRTWLVGLGLARYAPLFQIHEVDEQILSHLTLEDLKDMGINAVGSRRKLYAAIQNLRKASRELFP